MNPKLSIPPVIALALAGILITSQHQSISSLEDASAALQKHLAAARSSIPGTDPSHAKATAVIQAAKNKEPLDWKKFAAQLVDFGRDPFGGNLQIMNDFQQRLQSMSKEELCAALDEIAALDLPAESRARLGFLLIKPLAAKDLQLALGQFIDGIKEDSGGLSRRLTDVFKAWATKDPAKAIAWFDQQIANGQFDTKEVNGRCIGRNMFEADLINLLLSSAPADASRRLAAIPAELRAGVLMQHPLQLLEEGKQLAFATLVRELVPGNEQIKLITDEARGLGYGDVTRFMDRIAATPAERLACVEKVAEAQIRSIAGGRKITREDLDTLRDWTTRQAPATTGRITGKALADALRNGGKLDFAAASELALHYHQASGNDDVLISFLNDSSGHENADQARALAAKITDAKRREEILKKL